MAKRKVKGAVKRQRFRSNVFHPKVKQPVTFELTADGHERLRAVMDRCQVSIGDAVEYMLRTLGDKMTARKFLRAGRAVHADAAALNN